MRYTALIDGKRGAYGAVFPDLPGCTAMGRTLDEALANAAEALRDWAALTAEGGHPIPPPRPAEKLKGDAEVAAALAAIDSEAGRRGITRSALIELMAKRSLPELG